MEAADPAALQRIWKGLSDEYMTDLAGLPKKMAATPRTEEVAKYAAELASGHPSDAARKYLDRFVESMRIKATRGWEFYAEPTTTPVGPTPRELALHAGAVRLYRYGTAPHAPGRPPLVMVYSIINKAYILDLMPGQSVIAHLLSRGVDVWLVEWDEGKPGCRDTLDQYLNPWLKTAIGHVQDATGFDQVTLFGWCVGGTMALMYAALFPEDICGLITLTTPVTSSGSGVLELWLDPALFPMDDILGAYGYMPGKVVRQSLIALKPYMEVLKWRGFYENLHDDAAMALFLPVDKWANDNPDVAGEVFRKFVVDIYREDRLTKGQCMIHGKPVDLKRVTCPVLNLIAKKDWIVPADAAARVIDCVGSKDKVNEFIPGPHVGLILDPRARAGWDRIADFTLRGSPSPEPAAKAAPARAPVAAPEAPKATRPATRKPRAKKVPAPGGGTGGRGKTKKQE